MLKRPIDQPALKTPVTGSYSWMLTLQIAVMALLVAGIAGGGIFAWRYQHMHATQVWLDQHQAEYQWHHEVPHIQRPTWQRFQKDVAGLIGPASISDFHTVRLAGQLQDESLTRLSKLHHLQKLTLESDLATDETLSNVSQMRQLRNLTLSGKQFSFEGLLELRKLPNLRNLVLRNMSLSMAELAVLETAVPQANLKYRQSESGRTYERQVATRYPQAEKKPEPRPSGFAPLLGQTADSGADEAASRPAT